jgi:mRNA-degrading endonuclease toxin of MazEF toxin-antitoxin module
MTDIVKRLRAIDHLSIEDCFLQSPLFGDAADEIERLRAALWVFADEYDKAQPTKPTTPADHNPGCRCVRCAYDNARAALAQEARDESGTDRLYEARKVCASSTQELKLHMGEMTAQEVRSVKAALNWVASKLEKA